MIAGSRRCELGRTLGWAVASLFLVVVAGLWPPPVCSPDTTGSRRGLRDPIEPDTPYSLVRHLDRASRIETPIPALLEQLSRVAPTPLITRPVTVSRGATALEASRTGGRAGRGLIRVVSPLEVTDRVAVRWDLPWDSSAPRLLRGFVRYVPPERVPVATGSIPQIPTAFVTWAPAADTSGSTPAGEIVGPSLVVTDIGTSIGAVPAVSADRSSTRSRELLGLGGHARGRSSLERWTPIEVSIPPLEPRSVEGGASSARVPGRLELRLVCTSLLGEVQFSDLTLRVDSPVRRLLREGAYRYLPTTEFTYPLAKMLLARDAYRESVLALPPSRIGFDLVMPAHPALELQTVCRSLTAQSGEEVIFRVAVEEPVTGRCDTVLETACRASTDPAWQPRTIDLAAYAGRSVRLLLETDLRNGDTGGAGAADRTGPRVAPAWGDPVLLDRTPAAGRKNIILLTIDCMREDLLGVHGASRAATPVLDGVARRGVDFLNAYSVSHHTYIVLPMMMTGRMTRYEWIGSFNVIDPAVPSLADILSEDGYLVAGYCDDYYYNGFWKGFPARPDLDRLDLSRRDARLLADASAFICTHPDEPLFTWIHLKGPHPPCTGKPPADRFLVEEGLEAPWRELRRRAGVDDSLPTWPAVLDITRRADELPADVVSQTVGIARALYAGSMFATDRLIGRFLDELEEAGAMEDTLLVVTSDHGIQLREDSLVGRGPREEGMRVPLILAGPGLDGTPRRITRRVSTVAVLPTILDYLGLDPAEAVPGGTTAPSLLPLCLGREASDEGPVFGLFNALAAVWLGDHKYEVTQSFLNAMSAERGRIEGPVDPGETLLRLTPEHGEEALEITAANRDLLIEARRILVDFWGSLDSRTAQGAMNAELIEFFQRAGYMR